MLWRELNLILTLYTRRDYSAGPFRQYPVSPYIKQIHSNERMAHTGYTRCTIENR